MLGGRGRSGLFPGLGGGGSTQREGDGYTMGSGETPAGPQLPRGDTLFLAPALFPTATIRDPPTLELQSSPLV